MACARSSRTLVTLSAGVDRDGVASELGYLLSQCRLAGLVGLDLRVLGHRPHQFGDLRAEAIADLLRMDACVLDAVVQDPGRDHVLGVPGVVKKCRDLERVQNERRPVRLAVLTAVQLSGPGKRLAR